MAVKKVKTTYSLDPETIRDLDRMARRWDVSKSEALRRVVRIAAATESKPGAATVTALDEIQASVALTKGGADAWLGDINDERKVSPRQAGQATV